MDELQIIKDSNLGRVVAHNGGQRPVYLASMETTNPNVIALADLMFWSGQLREHCLFLQDGLPIERLSAQHERTVMYKGIFEMLFEQAVSLALDEKDIRDLSDDFIRETELLIGFKRQLETQQLSGAIYTLIWPSFIDHMAREAERTVSRLRSLLAGNIDFNREDTIKFWARITAEHAAYGSRWFDPDERETVKLIQQSEDVFRNIEKEHELEGNTDPVITEIDMAIEAQTRSLQGIKSARLKSMMTPTDVDHVRRESI